MYVLFICQIMKTKTKIRIFLKKSSEMLPPRNIYHEHWINVIPSILLSIYADINTGRKIKT